MRGLINLLLAVFVVTLAVVIGNRMSTEAMAVVIGVVCGVAASIPMSVILLMVAGRLGRGTSAAREQAMAGLAYPPMVVVGPGALPHRAGQFHGPYMMPGAMPSPPLMAPNEFAAYPMPPRRFEIVGEEAE